MPKQRKRKKAKSLKFGPDYFESRREFFSRGFLAKSPKERSGMLSKYFRKLNQSEKSLGNIRRWIEALSNRPKKNLSVEAIYKEVRRANKVFESLFLDTGTIFSKSYYRALTSHTHAHTPEQIKLHECHRHIVRIKAEYNPLRNWIKEVE